MIAIVFGATSIGILYGIVNLILIPYLSSKFGSPLIPAQLLSIGMFSTIFLGPLLGFMSDKIRKRTPFILVITIAAALSSIGLTFPSTMFLSLSAIFIVASTYTYLTLYSALVSDYSTTKSKDKNFGFVMGTMNVSTFLISLLIAFMYSKNQKLTFLALSLLIILPIIPVVIYTRKHPAPFTTRKSIGKATGTFNFLKVHPELIVYFFIQFCIWFSLGGLLPYLTSFLTGVGMNIGTASAWIGASTLFTGLMSFATGYLSKMIGRKKLLLISILAITVLFGVVAFLYQIVLSAHWFALFGLFAFVVFSVSIGFFYSLNTSTLSLLVSELEQGRAFGMNSVIMMVSESLSVSLMGNVIDHNGYKGMFVLIFIGSVFALTGVFYLFHLLKKELA